MGNLRRTHGRWSLVGLTLILLLLEIANLVAMTTVYGWFEANDAIAGSLAVAFVALLIGSFLAGTLTPSTTQLGRWLLRGAGLTIFLLQALSQMLVAYGNARVHLPPSVNDFFGWPTDTTQHVASIVFGSAINVVSAAFWLIVSQALATRAATDDTVAKVEDYLQRVG